MSDGPFYVDSYISYSHCFKTVFFRKLICSWLPFGWYKQLSLLCCHQVLYVKSTVSHNKITLFQQVNKMTFFHDLSICNAAPIKATNKGNPNIRWNSNESFECVTRFLLWIKLTLLLEIFRFLALNLSAVNDTAYIFKSSLKGCREMLLYDIFIRPHWEAS